MKSVSLPLFSEAKAATEKPQGWPFLRLGFRPFYVGAALVAALLVPLWLLLFLGHTVVTPAVPGLLWHAHEMLFGFAATVVIGFLMTRVKTGPGWPHRAGRCWALWRCCGWPHGWRRWAAPPGCMLLWTLRCCRSLR